MQLFAKREVHFRWEANWTYDVQEDFDTSQEKCSQTWAEYLKSQISL